MGHDTAAEIFMTSIRLHCRAITAPLMRTSLPAKNVDPLTALVQLVIPG